MTTIRSYLAALGRGYVWWCKITLGHTVDALLCSGFGNYRKAKGWFVLNPEKLSLNLVEGGKGGQMEEDGWRGRGQQSWKAE